VRVLWDRPPGEFSSFGTKATTQKPEIRAQATDVLYISKKDQFAISGIIFYVTDFKDDGWGVTTIELSLTAV
jgi:hypothetical protein